MVQTRQPEHEVVRALVKGQPELVVEAESPRRRALGFPPFGALAEVSGDDAAVLATVDALRGLDVAAASVQVLGPTDGKKSDLKVDSVVIAHAAGRATGRVRIVVDPARV